MARTELYHDAKELLRSSFKQTSLLATFVDQYILLYSRGTPSSK
jgi:hypothetical protein